MDGVRFLNSVAGGNTLTIGSGHDHQILNSIFYSTVAGGAPATVRSSWVRWPPAT